MKLSQSVIALAAMVCVSGTAFADIADFFVADAQGVIYSVNGQTLEASEVFAIEGGFAINEIMYVGGNKMLANVSGQLVQFDMTTGVETVIFDMRDVYGTGTYWTSGLARTSSDEIFFSVWAVTSDHPGVVQFGATYDPFANSYTELAEFEITRSGYFDHFQVEEDIFLAADWNSGRIHTFDVSTGAEIASFDPGFNPVSFFESDGDLYSLAKSGDIYLIDASAEEALYFGSVSGAGNSFIGATSFDNPFIIPTPSSLAIFGFAGLAAVRRRR